MVEVPLGLITCSLEDSVTGTVLSPNGRTELLDGSAEEPGGGLEGWEPGSFRVSMKVAWCTSLGDSSIE